jgi:hypothetical protein
VDVVQLAMDIGALSVRGNHDHAVVKERTLYVQALREMQAEIAASSSGSVENTSVRSDKPIGGKDDSNATPEASSEANAVSRKYAKFLENAAHSSATSKMPQHLRVAAALTEEQASWLADLPYFIRSLDLGAVFVHAGLLNNVRLPYQEPWIMMTMRSQMPSGRASSRCLSAHPWAKTWKGPLTAYFGHDTARGLQIYPSAYGIDTGEKKCIYDCVLRQYAVPMLPLGYPFRWSALQSELRKLVPDTFCLFARVCVWRQPDGGAAAGPDHRERARAAGLPEIQVADRLKTNSFGRESNTK